LNLNPMGLSSAALLKPSTNRGRLWIFPVILFFAALIFLERRHTFSQAADRDVAGYAVIGHEMLRGRLLYTDLWERKPPLLYATFAAAELIAGYGPRAIFLLNITAAMATLVCICVAGAQFGGWIAGGFAGGFWVLVGGDLFAQANQPNAEVFINFLMTAAFALLVRAPNRMGIRIGFALIVGALFSAATLFKHHAVVACAALLVGHVIVPRRGSDPAPRWKQRLVEAGIALLLLAITWWILFEYFAARGRLDDLIDVLFRQNAVYANGIFANLYSALIPLDLVRDLFVQSMAWAIPLIVLIAAAALLTIARGGGRLKFTAVPATIWLWGFWIVGSWLMVAVPGTFLAHYYQLLMPPICIASGWSAASLLRRENTPGRAASNLLRMSAVAAAVAFTAWAQLGQYRLPPGEWTARGFSNMPFFNNDFTFQKSVGEGISKLLAPGETFWNFGEDNTLYFTSRLSPPTGLLYMDPLVTGNETDRYWAHLMSDLNRAPPDLIVASLPTVQAIAPTAPIFSWIKAHYLAAPAGGLGQPVYFFFARRDSNLATRLHATATTGPAAKSAR